MDCWHCRRTAVGHAASVAEASAKTMPKTQPFILELFRGEGRHEGARRRGRTPLWRVHPTALIRIDLPELDA